MKRAIFLVFSVMLAFFSTQVSAENQAVTYTFSGGRFGDNLVAYLHAKWISYHYGVKMLYKPFPYSEQLFMHAAEQQYADHLYYQYSSFVTVKNEEHVIQNMRNSTLFLLPYFPESAYERDQSLHTSDPWGYLPIDWEDKGFRKELKRVVAPLAPLNKLVLPSDRITVAVHLRRGTGYDTEHTFRNAALKFPQDNFYIEELRWLSNFFSNQPLYVHLFTDDPEPLKIKLKYEDALSDYPIQFGCRAEGNTHYTNVLEDFFALTQFDCSIHGESNFPVCAGKICDYMVEIQPITFHWEGNTLLIDTVSRNVRSDMLPAFCAQDEAINRNEIRILQ